MNHTEDKTTKLPAPPDASATGDWLQLGLMLLLLVVGRLTATPQLNTAATNPPAKNGGVPMPASNKLPVHKATFFSSFANR